ncbi:class I SAM-dependent methyltransferase [Bdellovibrionales bacterium]|nr:class I SAM-dependent methyltransferase [Bdellovibrionales bacterium]
MNSVNITQHYDGKVEKIKESSLYGSKSFPLHVSAPYRRFELLLKKTRHSNTKFLDLCCGTGVHSIFPAKNKYLVVGIDLSLASISYAKELAKQHRVEHLCSFKRGDVLELSAQLPTDFDYVFMSGGLYYFDVNKLLPIIVNRLKEEGGEFVCIETNGSNMLMNIYRQIKYFRSDRRDMRSIKSLLNRSDIQKVSKHFNYCELEYFDFLTLFCIFFRKIPLVYEPLWKILSRVDYFLLNKVGLSFLAFKFLLRGGFKKPPHV